MIEKLDTIWAFETANIRVEVNALPEIDTLDLSWDETGVVAAQLRAGELEAFMVQVRVIHKPTDFEMATEYLGQCIYPSFSDFRDHIGLAAKCKADGRNYGSYFSDMVREACTVARQDFEWAKQSMDNTKIRNVG